jgi:hypothetical protein
MPRVKRGSPSDECDEPRHAAFAQLRPAGRSGIAFVLTTTVLLLVAVGSLRWVARSFAGGGPIVAAVVSRIEAATGTHIELGTVRVDWRMNTLSASPLAVTGADGVSILTARSVRVKLVPAALWQRRVVLDDVQVVEPSLHLRIFDGEVVGMTLPAAPRTAPRLSLEIRQLSVRGGALRLAFQEGPALAGSAARDPVWQRGVTLTLGRIDAQLVGGGSRDHALAVSIPDVTIEGVEGLTSLDPLDVELWVAGDGLLAPERVAFTEVRLVSEDIALAVSGMVDLRAPADTAAPADPFAIDVDVTGSANLATLGEAVGLPLRLAGETHGAARVTLDATHRTAIEGDLDVTGLGVDRMQLGTLRSTFRADEAALTLSDATWSIGDTVVRGRAQVSLVEGGPFEVDAEGERLSAYRLFAALGLSPRPWVDASVAGRIRGQGTLAPFVLDGAGEGVVTGMVVASKDARGALPGERVITVVRPIAADLAIHADPSGLAFAGDLDDGLTRGTGSCQLWFDARRGMLLEAASEQASLETLANRVSALRVSGQGSGSLRIEGPYQQVVISVDAKATNLTVMGFLLGAASGTVRATPPLVVFEDVVVTKGESTYAGTLSLDFSKNPAWRPPYLVLDVALTDAQAEDLRAVIPIDAKDPGLITLRELDLRGPIGGALHAEGPAGDNRPERMRGDGVVVGKRGARLWGQNVEGGNVRFHFNRGRMVVDHVGVGLVQDTVRVAR